MDAATEIVKHETARAERVDHFRRESLAIVVDPIAAFGSAIERAGLPIPQHIEPDGALHRFSTNDSAADDSGWYVLHVDGLPAGAFGDWRSGVSESWRADVGRRLTPDEERDHRERVRHMREQREAERAQRHAEAADRAAAVWDAAKPASEHAYLAAKGVRAHGVRTSHDGSLVIPMRDASGALCSLQFITPNGEKTFLTGGKVAGCYHAIGTPESGTLCIAEGYATAASIHEATGLAVAVAFNAGNLPAVASALREKLPNITIIIAGDNDESGVGQRKAREAAEAVGGRVAIPAELGRDWNDVHGADGAEAVRTGIDAASVVADPETSRELSEWRDPTPLPDGLPPVPEFDYELLPDAMRARVADIAERMQCPPDFPAIAMMTALSGIVGRRLTVKPKRRDDWTVVPNLWGMVIGRPGLMKTPAIDEVLRPLRAVQARALEEHRHALELHEAEGLVREQRKRVAKDRIRAALKKGDSGTASDLAQEAVSSDDTKPTCRRWLVNDSTVEKLGELLAENPNGLLLYRDELTGFFRTLERQGHEADRAFYLEAWNGDGSYTYDRIGRGTVHIQSVCLAVLGSLQPGPLSTLVRGMRGNGDDGLLQRFQLAVWPDQSGIWHNVDRRPDYAARDEIDALIGRITAMEAGAEPLRFDEDGQAMFNAWRTELEGRLRSNLHPMMEAHLAKYRSLVPALALLCHVAGASGGFGGSISVDSVTRAIAWAEYLEPHARRIYAPAVSPDMDAARALGARITAGELGGRFVLKDVYRLGWSGLSTREDANAAVTVLLDYDWLREEREQTRGRTRTVYIVNPAIRRQP